MTHNNATQALQVATLFMKLNQTFSDLHEILGLIGHLQIDCDSELTMSLECSVEEISRFLELHKLVIERNKDK